MRKMGKSAGFEKGEWQMIFANQKWGKVWNLRILKESIWTGKYKEDVSYNGYGTTCMIKMRKMNKFADFVKERIINDTDWPKWEKLWNLRILKESRKNYGIKYMTKNWKNERINKESCKNKSDKQSAKTSMKYVNM